MESSKSQMEVSKEKVIELCEPRREDNRWDYKRELKLSTKKEKWNLIKDFLAFANFGGGYLVLGVEKDNRTLHSCENEIDPADLGGLIETNLGHSIDFDIGYYTISEEIKVGLIYVHPSTRVYTSPKVLNDEKGKVIVGEHDVYFRRNTRSIKANPDDHQRLNNRLTHENGQASVPSNKPPVYLDEQQEVDFLWRTLNNKYELTAETFGVNLRGILYFSKHGKQDFAQLIAVSLPVFETFLKGDQLPTLNQLIGIANLAKIDVDFFF
jgi:predicted HTH transcriptional regulator